MNVIVDDKNMGMVKSVRESSYLFGLIASEKIVEFYPIAVKEGEHGRTKK